MSGGRTYRFYFNRAEDAPQVWSVDQGTVATEINVLGVRTLLTAVSRQDLDAQFPEPKAWMEVKDAILLVEDGWALLLDASDAMKSWMASGS